MQQDSKQPSEGQEAGSAAAAFDEEAAVQLAGLQAPLQHAVDEVSQQTSA